MNKSTDQGNRKRILTIIKLVPTGRVATYGQIAHLAGLPNNARQVGSILKSFSGPNIPWFRIVNSKGEISQRRNESSQSMQRDILEGEGVRFTESNRVDLSQYLWKPC
jgi:methylated-DNA-protein-cysteine methyltransferase-like protein